ncbi:DNA polymerase III subunit gamma and tau, partial [Janibacter sp. RAF20_2_2]
VPDVGVPAPAGGPMGADWGSAPSSAASAPAWATAPAPEPAPEPSPPAEPDDSSVSDDDEDIIDAGAAGPAVIERILGGTVIREE